MLYAERHRPRGVGLAGAVHCTWAVAEKNDWQFSNPRIDTVCTVLVLLLVNIILGLSQCMYCHTEQLMS